MILEYIGQWWGAPRPYYESKEAATERLPSREEKMII